MNQRKEIGKIIRKKRKERRYSQTEIGKELGVKAAAVSHWERGEAEPSLCRAIKLAKLLGIRLDTLKKFVS